MSNLHYCPTSKGIRFFGNIRRELEKNCLKRNIPLSNYRLTREFLEALQNKSSEIDNVFISAHGGKNAILYPTTDKYLKAIAIDKAHLFSNKFVFANSCYTAQNFGPTLIANGAISYIGFNDSISFLFITEKVNKNKDKKALKEKILKYIYTQSISESLVAFLNNCLTAMELKETLIFNLLKKMREITKKSNLEISLLFSASLKIIDTNLLNDIQIEFIAKMNKLQDLIEIYGEINYISSEGLNNLEKEKLIKIKEKFETLSLNHTSYMRHFSKEIEALICS